MDRRILVVGTRPGNLGDAIANAIQNLEGEDGSPIAGCVVARAGKAEDDAEYLCDVTSRRTIVRCLESFHPTDVVCCVGINLPDGENANDFDRQLHVNAFGPMQLLMESIDWWYRSRDAIGDGYNFVAVSSNSAHIARSQSAGYCASKAALSMALRCVARDVAARTDDIMVWGYEPGWIDGTPMSEEVLNRIAARSVEPHRIPGGHGINRDWLARRIVRDLADSHSGLNGTMIRIDGGEQ